jgi:hypothetical protein
LKFSRRQQKNKNSRIRKFNKKTKNFWMNLFTKNTTVFRMLVETTGLSKLFATASADVIFLARVNWHMLAEIPFMFESFATQLAHKPRLIHTLRAVGGAGKVLERWQT